MNRIAINRSALGLVILLAFSSASCTGTSNDNAQNDACIAKTPADARFVWVYYPGYGCGPLTPTGRGVFGG